MTIADEPTNPQQGKKLEKSLDAVAALRQAMEKRLVEARQQAAAPEPQPAPEPPPQPKAKAESRSQSKADPSEDSTDGAQPLNFDPLEWGQILMHVSERSHALILDYMTRMRDRPIESAPFVPGPMIDSFVELSNRMLGDPEAFTEAQLAMWQHSLDITRASLMRAQGMSVPSHFTETNDKRFKAKDWQTNWMFDCLRQSYLSNADEARRLVQHESHNVNNKLAKKIDFYTRLFVDATAPSNFWLTNPEVLRATQESGGENLVKGLENLLQDMERGNGTLRIRMSDYNAFEVGKNIAATPGKVVYQNDLMQLIQYAPSTPSVHKVPLLILPPWINKYYILDLREKNSLIRYLVAQGFTVFCISWVNPIKRHALTQFEDYMDKGALPALREVKRITGEDAVNVAGYCIGGTMLACTQAWLAAQDTYPADLPTITSATYLTAMIDFANPGDLGVFIDEEQIGMLEERMARQGFLDAGSLMLTFNLLRANDLIWPFVINNYLLGREPFPFDILYWNADSTNLPAAMHSYYLRKMYLENRLVAPNALRMKDTPLDIGLIETPIFMLSTREDHIAPWQSTYAATQLFKGPVTFTLSGSGHIAGVINAPDAGKYDYMTNSACPENTEEWLAGAESHKGSWWPAWVKWLETYAGETVPRREVTNGIEDAPGSYVKVRAV